MSQETNPEILNKSGNGDQALDSLNFEFPDSDLWLITRDDPIPLQLNGRWSFDNGGSQVQLVNLGQFEQDIVKQTGSDDTVILPVTSQLTHSRSSQIPVINYDKIITSEDRRRSSDRSGRFPIESPGAVLIQLPPTITEGLWVKPHSQNLFETSVDRRQNFFTQNRNTLNDEITNNYNNSDLQTVYLPITEAVSRLPYPELEPQAELNIPVGQYYQIPSQASAAVTEDSTNGSTHRNSQSGNFEQNILIPREPVNSATSSINYPEYQTNDDESNISSTGGYNSYGNVLTGEDIELLERLGILSSLIIAPKNSSNDFSYAVNRHGESEIKPSLIDNDGQGRLIKPNKESKGNTSGMVLNNKPQFKTAEYHSNIPEDAGIHNNAQRLPSYLFLQPQNITRRNASEDGMKPQITYKLIDSQLVEFLHLLGLDTEDFLNRSFVTPSRENFNNSGENDAANYKRNSEFNILKDHKSRSSFNDTIILGPNKEHGIVSTATLSISSKLDNGNNTIRRTVDQGDFVQPSVTNRKIQPRVLEEPFVSENEVLQLLSNKAIPLSEEKIERLKKLKVQSQPYIFGFKQDDGNGTLQHRNETSDEKGIVKGSYSYIDPFGIYRKVYYTADEQGFHAVVKTNEPGTVSHSTADAVFMSETPPLAALLKMMDYMKYKSSSNFTGKS